MVMDIRDLGYILRRGYSSLAPGFPVRGTYPDGFIREFVVDRVRILVQYNVRGSPRLGSLKVNFT